MLDSQKITANNYESLLKQAGWIVNSADEISKQMQLKDLPDLNVYLLERRITCMTVASIVSAINRACVENKKITVANYNIHSFNLSMQLPWFYEFLQSSQITNCDSMGILKAIDYMGFKLPRDYRASYTLLMPTVLEECNKNSFRVFLLGAKPQYLKASLENLHREYPNAVFAGHHGYFDKDNVQHNKAIIEQINQFKPHILLVGMGMPIQEYWVCKYRQYLQVNAIMLGGAIIDRLAGVVPDCPSFIANIGCEWLYRLSREPKRLAARYLLGNPAFLLHIALGKFFAPPLHVELMSPDFDSSKDCTVVSTPKYDESNINIDSRIKRIVDYFLSANLLTKKQIETALSEQKLTGLLVSEFLMKQSDIREENIEGLVNVIRNL